MGWTLSDETGWCSVVSKKKICQKGGDKNNDDFDMDITKERSLEKALNVKNKTPDEKPPTENNIWGNRKWLFWWIKIKTPKRVPYGIQSGI